MVCGSSGLNVGHVELDTLQRVVLELPNTYGVDKVSTGLKR